MSQYLALLRGVNLGKRRIRMADLRAAFESWGYGNPRTLLASGNVVFESDEADPATLRSAIEQNLQKRFGFWVPAIVRTEQEIGELISAKPFKRVTVTENTRLYVTFLSEPAESDLKMPYTSLDGNYRILNVAPGHLVSVLTLTPKSGTTDAMDILAKQYGDGITTRNWNTILKIHAKMEGA